MTLTPLKARMLDYIHHLSLYDYIAYGWLVAVLVGFLLFAVVLAGRYLKLSLYLILTVLLLMMVGPFLIKYGLDQTVRKVVLVDTNATQLHFAKNLIVTGKIANQGRIDLSGCRIFVHVVKKDDNRYKQLLFRFKPLRKKSAHIKAPLPKGEEMSYRVVFDHFVLDEGSYIVKQRAECY